ncbi:MAG: hypothetical protein V9F03_07585 [Microthrixaceae bacterium]
MDPASGGSSPQAAPSMIPIEAPSVAVVGGGVLGARIARELLTHISDPWVRPSRIVLVTRRPERAKVLRGSFGHDLRVIDDTTESWAPGDDTDIVILARESESQFALARQAISGQSHVISTSDDLAEVEELLTLDTDARGQGVTVALGATMSPGLSCLLASHAADLFDRVDEVHVGRVGAGGPSCARSRLRALRGTALELRSKEWTRRPGFSGRELLWFPDPIGGRDCYRAALVDPLLLAPHFVDADRITSRIGATRRDRALAPFPVLLPPPEDGGVGALRVELRGDVGGERRTVVYGSLDRPSVAASATAAVTALWLARGSAPVGVMGLAGLGGTLEMLNELARRGVRAASFEGGAITAVAKP